MSDMKPSTALILADTVRKQYASAGRTGRLAMIKSLGASGRFSPYDIHKIAVKPSIKWITKQLDDAGIAYPVRQPAEWNADSLDALIVLAVSHEDDCYVHGPLVRTLYQWGNSPKAISRLTNIPQAFLREALDGGTLQPTR